MGADESALDSHAKRFYEDDSYFADEEETEFMRKNPVLQRNEKKVIENPADVSRIEDDEETSFMGISLG